MVSLTGFSPNTKAQSSEVNTNFENINGVLRPVFEFGITSAFVFTNITPPMIVTQSMTVIKAYARAINGPTGADLIFDINKNGTTIWSTQENRLTISAGGNSGTQTSFNTTSLSEGDYLTIDVDQIGSTVGGSNIVVALKCSL